MPDRIGEIRQVCVFQQVNRTKLVLPEVLSDCSYRKGVLIDGVESGSISHSEPKMDAGAHGRCQQ